MDSPYRTCSICKLDKLETNFYKSYTAKNRTNPYVYRRCISCIKQNEQKTYRQTYQTKNRPKLTEQQLHRVQQKKLKAIELLGGKCVDCCEVFPACVYDFHHLDPSTKETTPAKVFNKKWELVLIEIQKCILLCANCHRKRHFT